MAYFAHLDENDIVDFVALINNDECIDENGEESEQKGAEFCSSFWGLNGIWVQTSYNGRIRKNYAGVGYTYDRQRDAFIPPQPFPSWLLDEDECQWFPPTPRPIDEKAYNWDEQNLRWVELTETLDGHT